MVSRRMVLTAMVAGLAAPVLAACGAAPTRASGSGASGSVTIAESGSSLLYPLFNIWVPVYEGLHPNVKISTASTGSGTGINDAVQGLVQIGASDAYMSNAEVQAAPNILNIPLAISAQQINYHIPGLSASTHLNLSAEVLAGIYTGSITTWNDSRITALNPGMTLPSNAIVPVHRSDGSGDTFLFTTYLTDSGGPAWQSIGYGTTVTWPQLPTEPTGDGNTGVIDVLKATPYSVGYVGISYLSTTVADGLGYAALQNKSGKFVLPTSSNISSAVSALAPSTPKDERVSLIDAPGDTSYPIINFEYALVSKTQSGAMAGALQQFLEWAISPTGGNSPSYLSTVHFTALPQVIVALSQAQINQISS